MIKRVPPPDGDPDAPLKALIFDSWYDSYRGVVVLIRVLDGAIRPKMKVRLMALGRDYEVEQVGVFLPKLLVMPELVVGDVGFVIAGIKTVSDAQIGDTLTETSRPTDTPCPGFTEMKPMVFAGLYPVEGHQYAELRESLEKLRLNDASFIFEPETSRGYASLDYHVSGFWTSPLVKLDLMVNGEPVDALSIIVHKESAYARGRALAVKLRQLIPRQMFEVAIQATVGGRIIARETVTALRKNVLAKCYGGDISRKRKLLEKQKEGKRRMKRVGRVEIPQEAFLAVLTVDSE